MIKKTAYDIYIDIKENIDIFNNHQQTLTELNKEYNKEYFNAKEYEKLLDKINKETKTFRGKRMTFYGGKYKIGDLVDANELTDIICFNNGKILCSGTKSEMLKYSKNNNVACGCLIALRYKKKNKHLEAKE